MRHDYRKPNKSDPLHWAAWIGDYRLVKAYINGWRKPRKNKLRKNNSDIVTGTGETNSTSSPKSKKCKNQYPKLEMIPRETKDYAGFTALHYAVIKRFEKVVKVLLEGSDVRFREIVDWSRKKTALHHCFSDYHHEPVQRIVELLLNGSRPRFRAMRDSNEESVLHIVARKGLIRFAKIIVDIEEPVFDESLTGEKSYMPPLIPAIRSANIEMVKLVSKACGPEAKYYFPTEVRRNPLLCAVDISPTGYGMNGLEMVEIVRFLLKDTPQSYREHRNNVVGGTILHMVCMNGILPMMELILDGTPPEYRAIRDLRGMTALHWAVRYRKSDMIRLLMDGAPEGYLDIPQYYKNFTATQLTNPKAHPEIVHALLDGIYLSEAEETCTNALFAASQNPKVMSSESSSAELWCLDGVIKESVLWMIGPRYKFSNTT
eukprot:TRINITY_DN1493_c0_g1_i1.p1 TRINITY_DN1493_c0_g1~~TRINITY_DN1493_c0_g1_i1.p1  ORF type:complete len:431 (+),score=65.17 TRINITY_DN1493_c0_g1_i1:133-1425(+)